MPTKYDSLIVGGGIAGLSTAYELSRLGENKICLVDEGISEISHIIPSETDSNSTSHSAGIITSQLWPPLDPKFARETMHIIKEVSSIEPSSQFVHSLPSLILCSRRDSYRILDELQSRLSNEGIRSDIMECNEVMKKFPCIRSERMLGASYSESGLLIDPRNYLARLMKCFNDYGGTIRKDKVLGLIEDHGCIIGIRTDAGILSADRVIIAAGTNSQDLLGKYLPIRLNNFLTRFYSSRLKYGMRDLPMIYDMDQQVYMRSEGQNEIIIGGGNESGYNNNDIQEVSIESQKDELKAWLGSSFRSTVTKIVFKSEGLCSEPYDQKPIVGKVRSVGSLYCIYGFGGLGLTVAPSLSRNLAESIIDGRMNNLLKDFAPERKS